MLGPYFFRNNALFPVAEAVVALDDLAYANGYGVYETLRVRSGTVFFPAEHESRLYHSARIIGLEHTFGERAVVDAMAELVRANSLEDANLRVMLVGGRESRLFVMALDPIVTDPRLYQAGARAITVAGERFLPQAKSLNMLLSTMAYRRAQADGAYDALLLNRRKEITEGTRTNFYVVRGEAVVTAPAGDVLEGVTRSVVLEVARGSGVSVRQEPVLLSSLADAEGCFLTSTSPGILPLRQVDGYSFHVPAVVRKLMSAYDHYLEEYVTGRGGAT